MPFSSIAANALSCRALPYRDPGIVVALNLRCADGRAEKCVARFSCCATIMTEQRCSSVPTLLLRNSVAEVLAQVLQPEDLLPKTVFRKKEH